MIESRWGGEIFRTCPDQPWTPPSLLYNRYWVFPGGKERPGRDAGPSPPSSAVVMSYTSTPPIDRTACTEPQCLYKGDLYLDIPLISPYVTLKLATMTGVALSHKKVGGPYSRKFPSI